MSYRVTLSLLPTVYTWILLYYPFCQYMCFDQRVWAIYLVITDRKELAIDILLFVFCYLIAFFFFFLPLISFLTAFFCVWLVFICCSFRFCLCFLWWCYWGLLPDVLEVNIKTLGIWGKKTFSISWLWRRQKSSLNLSLRVAFKTIILLEKF